MGKDKKHQPRRPPTGRVIVPGQAEPTPPRYTPAQLEAAALDARNMTAESKIIQTCLAIDIASRQLYLKTREVMDNEIQEGWEVQNGELVVQTLVMAAQNKAASAPVRAADLKQSIIETVLPFLEIVAQAEAQAEADAAKKAND